MVKHDGAIGDCGYTIPALNALKEAYQYIYQSCTNRGLTALQDTGLIDKFIVKPKGFREWKEWEQRAWLVSETAEIDFDRVINFHGVVPGKYLFHLKDRQSQQSQADKIANAKGINFFDEMSRRAETPEAIGQRPITRHLHHERIWLRNFRLSYGIPDNAYIIGWHFAGSGPIKWYPHFDKVMQKGIMRMYDDVYVVALGDTEGKMDWDSKYHHGRYINFRGTFRQAYILTSIMDLLIAPETSVYVFAQAYTTPKILLATHTDGTHITCGTETIILYPECDCAPCYNIVWDCTKHPDGDYPLCIGSIRPETIIKAIESKMIPFDTEESLGVGALDHRNPKSSISPSL